MHEIFISYRRDDSQDATGRIHDWLENYFGPATIYRDIDRIRGGVNFPAELENALQKCKVVLVVIGASWAKMTDAKGTVRIFAAEDFVRQEVARALELGVRIIPVLVGYAHMPNRDEIPEEIAPLREVNAVSVEPGINFRNGLHELVRRIESFTELIADDYPAIIGQCRALGLVSASLGLFSTNVAVIDRLRHCLDLLIIMNDGRGFLDSMQEDLRARNKDPKKSTRIVLLHPKSAFLDQLIKKNGKPKSTQISEIERAYNALRAIHGRPSSIKVHGSFGFFPGSYLVTEHEAFVSQFFCEERGSLPVFRFNRAHGDDSGMYAHIAADAEAVFTKSEPLNEIDFK